MRLDLLRQVHAALERQRLHGCHHAADKLAEIQLLHSQQLLASIGAGERQQLADQLGHARGVFAQTAQKLFVFGRSALVFERHVDLAGQHGQRRAQLV